MGFYGNITSTDKTQFTFDRIYSSRRAMELNLPTDDIYLGRYVLIEYDLSPEPDTLDTFIQLYWNDGKFYTSPGFEQRTRVKYAELEEHEIIYIIQDGKQVFYKYIGADPDGSGYAAFELVTASEENYTKNYNIDIKYYGDSRGYDSTVWQKVFTQDNEKYVQIAELNSVVPTFDLVADAPTMTPITPHFDADSTNVYYKLHWQPQWGFRVKQSTGKSDETANWKTPVYDPVTDKKEIIEDTVNADIYYNKAGFEEYRVSYDDETENHIGISLNQSGQKYYTHDGTGRMLPAEDIQELSIKLPAIGNTISRAWDVVHGPQRNDSVVDSLQGRLNFFRDEIKENEIPVQSSGQYLVGTKINGNTQHEVAKDTILNEKLSTSYNEDDAWIQTSVNVIDNDNFHQNAISIHHTFHPQTDTKSTSNVNKNGDTIQLYTPKVDKAGHVVGKNTETVTLPYGFKYITTNGVGSNTSNMSINSNTIEADNTQDTFGINSDNKWIRISNNSTSDSITIAHEIHNIDIANAADTNLNGNGDTITIQDTAYDIAGHVVENKKHKYTLPYGFKYITTNGVDSSINELTVNNQRIQANNTQDNYTINSANKWIRLANNDTNNTTLIGHAQTSIVNQANKDYGLVKDISINDLDTDNKFEVPVFKFDEAGHIIKAETHTVEIPEIFTTVDVVPTSTNVSDSGTYSQGSISADSLTDNLTFTSGNKWIELPVNETNDTITVQHYVKKFNETTDSVNFNSGKNKFNIQKINWDEAGHLISSKNVEYTLPNDFKTIKILNSGNNIVDTMTSVSNNNIIASTPIDSMTFDTGNRWIQINADGANKIAKLQHALAGTASTTVGQAADNTTIKFNETFKVLQVGIDETGHVKDLNSRTIKLPNPTLTTTGTGNVLTGLSLNTDGSGAFTSTFNNIGNLNLTGYTLGTDGGKIIATDTLNKALGKVQVQINNLNKTVNANEEDIEKKVSDLNNLVNSNKEDVENKISNLNSLINTNEQDIEKKVSDLNNLVGTNKQDAENKISNLNSLINTNEQDIESKVSNLSNLVETNKNNVEKELSDLNTLINTNEQDIENKVSNLSKLIGSDSVSNQINNALQNYMTTEVLNNTFAKIEALTQLNNTLTQKIEDLELRLQKLENPPIE